MKTNLRLKMSALFLLVAVGISGCNREPGSTVATVAPPSPTPTATPLIKIEPMPVTLPLVDALFHNDQTFARDLMDRVPLTDGQIALLRTIARVETSKLNENESSEWQRSTTDAAVYAKEKLTQTLGEDKAQKFSTIVQAHWNGSVDIAQTPPTAEASLPHPEASPIALSPTPESAAGAIASPSPSPSPINQPSPSPTPSTAPAFFGVPVDTRIVINAPAHRMDAFENGRLVKSYLIAIGYPEFPVPYGERKAGSIIFNPTWTPPDEPWVESSNKVKVGQRIAAGDKLNPLGSLKIPVGMPSLIHGGKRPAQIGNFGSHGCVGLTDDQAKDFAKHLAALGGVELTDDQIATYRKTPGQTKSLKLTQEIPVEFRYDTIVVSDGQLHIYRDVYDRDTNTEENLQLVLGVYGVSLENFSVEERRRATEALELMSHPVSGKSLDADLTELEKKERKKKNIENQKVSKMVPGEREMVIDVAALAGKGYPAPVDLSDGLPPVPKDKAAALKEKAALTRKKVM